MVKSLVLLAAAAVVGVAAADKELSLRGPRPKPVIAEDVEIDNTDVCSIIGGHLPSQCNCVTSGLAGKISCNFSLFSDNIDLSANVQPCSNPADVVFEVQDSKFGVDFSHTVTLGIDDSIPIPGLTFGIPGYASAGAVLDVTLEGNLGDITFDAALDACAKVFGVSVCGSDLTSDLPWTVLSGTFDFSNVCQ